MRQTVLAISVAVIIGCSKKPECRYFELAKQGKAISLRNDNIKKLNADIRSQCSQNVFTVDESCRSRLLTAFGQQHDCL